MAKAISDKKGERIVAVQVGQLENALMDFLIICEVTNTRQSSAIADHIEEEIKQKCSRKPYNIDGLKQSNWVVMDYGDIMVHIMTKEYRSYYQLEELWMDVPQYQLGGA